MREDYDVLVIGAGAAGLFCAGSAALQGRRVMVLEHGAAPGRKILISGGGRCNFTNLDVSSKNFISQNPHFCKSALAGFTPKNFLSLVEQAGIAWHEKTLGQLFCDGSAQEILQLLLARLPPGALRCQVNISNVSHTERFVVETDKGVFTSRNLVVATGGLSIPKMGVSDFAYRLAGQFGHGVVTPRPALVPLVFGTQENAWMQSLAGVSAPVTVSMGKVRFSENLLFTHRGLSGPAILQISSYLKADDACYVDFAPGLSLADKLLAAKRGRPKAGLKAILSDDLPARLAAHFAGQDTRGLADWPDKSLRTLGESLNHYRLAPSGTEGFAKAEVTSGGVDTALLDSRDGSSKNQPGLFFIGEAVDVTGWLGGYNFQWAWASGHAAAKGLRL